MFGWVQSLDNTTTPLFFVSFSVTLYGIMMLHSHQVLEHNLPPATTTVTYMFNVSQSIPNLTLEPALLLLKLLDMP